MSENDPWKKVGTYAADICLDDGDLTDVDVCLRTEVDAARAAEATQHAQEIAAKDEHIAVVEGVLREHSEFGGLFQPGGRFHRVANLRLGGSAVADGGRWLVARLAAVEAERDNQYTQAVEATQRALLAEAERDRLKAANERLERLVKSQRPELSQLRDVECGLRAYLQNGAKQLERTHALVQSLLPPNDDDLPTFGELRGLMSAALSGEGTKP